MRLPVNIRQLSRLGLIQAVNYGANSMVLTCYVTIIFLIATFVVYETLVQLHPEPLGSTVRSTLTSINTQDGTQLSHLWGQYSPYHELPSEISQQLPAGCYYTFVQLLSRHGARDPTAFKTRRYRVLIDRLQSNVQSFPGQYSFLKDYAYNLGADQLTTFGEHELWISGKYFYARYANLTRRRLPFIRASGNDRVIASAQKFAQGYHEANNADMTASGTLPRPSISVIISEGDTYNNTLSVKTCPAFSQKPNIDVGPDAKAAWAAIFVPPIQGRLNKEMVGAQLSIDDTVSLMDLCPFEAVAQSESLVESPFCKLFDLDEWRSYDYYQTLDKYYGHGMGNPLAPTLGVGFVNEVIARLTHSPVQDETSTNQTLDSSSSTFPLDVDLYADFSHDNDMEAIFAALGLYNTTNSLSIAHIQEAEHSDGFSSSWTVPFAARLYVEKMRCVGEDTEHVRILLNNRVMALQSCNMDSLGRCTLSEFIQGLAFARSGGIWEDCFVY